MKTVLLSKKNEELQHLEKNYITILDLLSHGYNMQEIAEEINMPQKTVEKRVQRLKELLGAINIPHMIRVGFKQKLIK